MDNNGDIRLGKMEFLAKALICAAIGLLITMLLLLGFSILMSAGAGLIQLEDQYVIISVVIGAAFSGALCVRKKERGVLIAGFLTGVCYILMMLIGALLIPKSGNEGGILLKNTIAALCGGCFGGTLHLYRRNKKSKLRR